MRRVIGFDETVAPQSSYLNDVRFSPNGNWAYIADSGKGAIVVVDLATGQGRRLLDGHPSTQFEKDVTIVIDGRELRRPDGRQPMFNSDGIALDGRGEYLYWQALTGKTLYRIPTAALVDVSAKADQIGQRVEKVATTEPVDGLWIDGRNRIYLSSLQDNAVKVLAEGQITTLVQDLPTALARHIRAGSRRRDLRDGLSHPGFAVVPQGLGPYADRDALAAVRARRRDLADVVARLQPLRRGRLHRARRRRRRDRGRDADLPRPGHGGGEGAPRGGGAGFQHKEREAFKKSWSRPSPRSGRSTRASRSRSGRPTSTALA